MQNGLLNFYNNFISQAYVQNSSYGLSYAAEALRHPVIRFFWKPSPHARLYFSFFFIPILYMLCILLMAWIKIAGYKWSYSPVCKGLLSASVTHPPTCSLSFSLPLSLRLSVMKVCRYSYSLFQPPCCKGLPLVLTEHARLLLAGVEQTARISNEGA